jgi:hypothetical protein
LVWSGPGDGRPFAEAAGTGSCAPPNGLGSDPELAARATPPAAVTAIATAAALTVSSFATADFIIEDLLT